LWKEWAAVIYGTGIDSIEVARIAEQVEKESGFKERVFTAGEIAYCESKASRGQNFAARFAAKEAFMKALGTGWRDGIAFTDIEIINDSLGRPQLVIQGKAQEIVHARNITAMHVSLSHLKEIATAIVILET
jgi:holo-[acyl-carrier protein] synthase